jgi:hypothetical protein
MSCHWLLTRLLCNVICHDRLKVILTCGVKMITCNVHERCLTVSWPHTCIVKFVFVAFRCLWSKIECNVHEHCLIITWPHICVVKFSLWCLDIYVALLKTYNKLDHSFIIVWWWDLIEWSINGWFLPSQWNQNVLLTMWSSVDGK